MQEAVGLIEVADVNQATLRLFGAESKNQLLGPLDIVLDAVSIVALSETIVAIDEGQIDIESESSAVTFKGKRLSLLVKTYIPPANAPYSKMIVSLIDVTEQKRVEDVLRDSEERFRTLYTDSRDAIMVLSPERGFLAGNPAAITLFGLQDSNDFSIQTPASLSPEFQPDGATSSIKSQEMMRLALEKGSHTFEWVHRRADGTEFPAMVLLSRFKSRGAQILQATVRDITEQKRNEAALVWERNLLNMLLDNLPDRIYFKDKMSRFIRSSRSHARQLGLTDPSQQIGKTDADFFGADHARRAFEDEQRIIQTGESLLEMEERETYPDPPDTWALTTKLPLRDQNGAVVGTFGISHDITARKELEAQNEYLAALVESAADAIVGIAVNRTINAWNKGAQEMFGYSAEEAIGQLTSLIIPAELENEVLKFREQIARGEVLGNIETRITRKNGTSVDLSLTLSGVRDAKGKLVAFTSVARDVTAKKALDAQIARAQRLESLATLAGGVAHQFNNINTVILGYLDLIRSKKDLPDRLATYVEAMHVSVGKAVDITDRLLMLTESSSTRSNTLRLDALARATIACNKIRIEEGNVCLVLELSGTPPIAADESRLTFVLASLIGNALDSLLDRIVRILTVRTGSEKETVFFEVEDTGCGFPKRSSPSLYAVLLRQRRMGTHGLASG